MTAIPWAELAGRITHLVRQTILSTILPGLVVLVELWLIAGQPELGAAGRLPVVVRAGLAVYFAYVLGFVARHAAFIVADLRLARNEAGGDGSRARTERPAPYGVTEVTTGLHSREAFTHNIELLRATFGPAAVDAALAEYPLTVAMAGTEDARYDDVFHYAKTWLRVHAPYLSVDWLEEEANAVLTAILPMLLVPVAFARIDVAAGWVAAAVLAAPAAVVVLLNRATELRHAEDFLVLRNLVFASSLRGAAHSDSDAAGQ